jgi:hypothetical protein
MLRSRATRRAALLLPRVSAAAAGGTLEAVDVLRRRLEDERGVRVVRGTPVVKRGSHFVAHAAVGVTTAADVAQFGDFVRAACDSDVTHAFMQAHALPCGARGSDDDGERGAGRRIGAVVWPAAGAGGAGGGERGVCVAVSRWYGGVPLGSARFALIARCAEEAVACARATEELCP